MNKEIFIEECKKLNIFVNDDIYSNLEKYYELLIEWNNKFNLTTILNKDEVFLLHFYDSICLSKSVDLKKYNNLCDFGTGAGFPGVIIAIFYNNINVTLIESNNKKCDFLKHVVKTLNLNNVEVVNDRIENYSIYNREKFDIVTCRAVSMLPILLELSIAVIKKDGFLLPLKANCDDEIIKYKYLEKELGIDLVSIVRYKLPITNASRMIPIYKKSKKTESKYPRNYSQIVKKYKRKNN